MSIGFRRGFATVIDAVRGTLADAALAGAMSAADFLKLIPQLDTPGLPVVAENIVTAPLDMLAASNTVYEAAPARPGYYTLPLGFRVWADSKTGVAIAALQLTLGNVSGGGSWDNISTNIVISAANLNGPMPFSLTNLTGTGGNTNGQIVNSPLQSRIINLPAQTGLVTLSCRFITSVLYLPA